MKGLEVGELLGLIITKNYDENKKVKVIIETESSHTESISIKNIECIDKDVIISSDINSKETMTLRKLIFQLHRHQSSRQIVFKVYNGYECIVSTNVPKISDIKLNENEDFIQFNISIDK